MKGFISLDFKSKLLEYASTLGGITTGQAVTRAG